MCRLTTVFVELFVWVAAAFIIGFSWKNSSIVSDVDLCRLTTRIIILRNLHNAMTYLRIATETTHGWRVIKLHTNDESVSKSKSTFVGLSIYFYACSFQLWAPREMPIKSS